jgi:hypothetical protein
MRRLSRWLMSRAVVRNSHHQTNQKAQVLPAKPKVEFLEDRLVPNSTAFAVGAARGEQPQVTLYNGDGTVQQQFLAYETSFTGGVRTAVMDLNGDGVWDLVTTPLTAGGGRIRAFDGKTAAPLADFWAADPEWRGALSVTAGVVASGQFGIMVGSGPGSEAVVSVYTLDGVKLREFRPLESNYTGGVNVTYSPGSKDGGAGTILVSPRIGGGPRLLALDVETGAVEFDQFVYDPGFRGGLSVSCGDVNGDHRTDMIVGAGPGGGPHIRAFDVLDGKIIADFMAGIGKDNQGVTVGAVGETDTEPAAVLVLSKTGNVAVYNFATGQVMSSNSSVLAQKAQNLLIGSGQTFSSTAASSVIVFFRNLTHEAAALQPIGQFNGSPWYEGESLQFSMQASQPGLIGNDFTAIVNPLGTGTGQATKVLDVNRVEKTFFIPAGTFGLIPGSEFRLNVVDDLAYEGSEGSELYGKLPNPGVGSYLPFSGADTAFIAINDGLDCTCPANPTGMGPQEGLDTQRNTIPPKLSGGIGAEGNVSMAGPSVGSAGFGASLLSPMTWSNSAAWTWDTGSTNDVLGNGWGAVFQQPRLLVDAPDPTTGQTYFTLVDGTQTKAIWQKSLIGPMNYVYTPIVGTPTSYTFQSASGGFVATDGSGGKLYFTTINTTTGAADFSKFLTPNGDITEVSAKDAAGRPLAITRNDSSTGTTQTERLSFSYDAVTSKATNVVLERQTSSGANWQTIRSQAFSYHDGTTTAGNNGDLKTVTIRDGSNQVLDSAYYRYYLPGEANGYAGGLKVAVQGAEYDRLVSLYTNPDLATASQVAVYADYQFEFDPARRVTKAVVAGAGCSACTGGQGTYSYQYSINLVNGGGSNWTYKTTETRDDGTIEVVYADGYGRAMGRKIVTNGQTWNWYWSYSGSGQVLFEAGPDAVLALDETKADLIGTTGLSATAGQITVYSYTGQQFTGTSIKKGSSGTAIAQSAQAYVTNTVGGTNFVQVASNTQYPNMTTVNPETTSYSYTYFSGTNVIPQRPRSSPPQRTARIRPRWPRHSTTAKGGISGCEIRTTS